jgi:two-component system, LytTR family, response regulator
VRIGVLVVDDEPLARRKLAGLVADVPWAVQVGEASDGPSAIEAVRRMRPDVVFLDIQMPELSGTEVVERLRELDAIPAIIFTTAFQEYAVTAFELEAVDYLLKPFGARRFLAALERARQAVATHGTVVTLDRARSALAASSARAPLERIYVREGSTILPLALPAIERVEAQDDYAMIHAHGHRYLVGLRLATLEARLPNPPFLRVHRSHIVNLDHVGQMRLLDSGQVEVHMKSGATVPVSRIRSQELRRLSR